MAYRRSMTIRTPDESPQATLPLSSEEEQEFPPGPPVPSTPPLRATVPVRTVLVQDAMTRTVFTTFPTSSLLDAATEMHHHHVTGLPVVSPQGGVVGVVTETDVMRVLGLGRATGALALILPAGAGRTDPAPARELDEIRGRLDSTRVSEAMTPGPVSIRSSQTLEDASRLLLAEKVNRLPVVDDGRLVGILTRHDVVRAVYLAPPATRSDGSSV